MPSEHGHGSQDHNLSFGHHGDFIDRASRDIATGMSSMLEEIKRTALDSDAINEIRKTDPVAADEWDAIRNAIIEAEGKTTTSK